jgi:hypothetical protein
MSRPKPTVLLSKTDPSGLVTTEVLAAEAVYALFYDGQPIALRRRNPLLDYPGPKYPRTVFVSAGHCFGAKRKLNRLFKTDKFAVWELSLKGARELPGDYHEDLVRGQ